MLGLGFRVLGSRVLGFRVEGWVVLCLHCLHAWQYKSSRREPWPMLQLRLKPHAVAAPLWGSCSRIYAFKQELRQCQAKRHIHVEQPAVQHCRVRARRLQKHVAAGV